MFFNGKIKAERDQARYERDYYKKQYEESEESQSSLWDKYMVAMKDLRATQAELDRVMLEHCPDEMTDEQKARWEAAQHPVDYEYDPHPVCDCGR